MAPNQHTSPTLSEQEIQDILDAMPPEQLQPEGHQTTCNIQIATAPVKSLNSNAHELKCDSRATARSERKRTRERQRRDDVNKQFAGLTRLLRQIEEDDLAENNELTTSCRRLTGQTNRVDLISNAILVLEQKHKAGKNRKNEINKLKQELADTNKMVEDTAARLKEATMYQQYSSPNQQVMMMMPMMVSPEIARSASAGMYSNGMFPMAPYQTNGMPQMFPTMMSQVSNQQVPGVATSQKSQSPEGQTCNSSSDAINRQQKNEIPSPPATNETVSSDSAWSKTTTAVNPQQQGKAWHHPSSNTVSSPKADGGNLAHCA